MNNNIITNVLNETIEQQEILAQDEYPEQENDFVNYQGQKKDLKEHQVQLLENQKYKRNFEKSYFNFFKNAILFVLFSIFNGLMPVAIVTLISYTDQLLPTNLWEGVNVGYGIQPAMAIGYLTAIQIGFIQISWTMSIATIYAFNYNQMKKGMLGFNNSESFTLLYRNCYTFTSFYSIIFIPIAIIVALLYNNFAVGHVNTLFGRTEGWWYILGTFVYNLLIGYLFSTLILIQYKVSSLFAIILTITSFGLIFAGLFAGTYIPKFAFELGYNQKNVANFLQNSYHVGLWSGLGMSIGLIVALILVSLCSMTLKRYLVKNNLPSSDFVKTLKLTWKQLLSIAMIQIFKAIAICGIAIQMGSNIWQAISLNYQLGRSIWYIVLYLIPCVSYGLADAITYLGITKTDTDYRNIIWISIITSLASIIISLVIAFLLYMFLFNENGDGLINFLVLCNTNSGAQVNIWLSKYLKNKDNVNSVNLTYLLETMLKNKDYLAIVTTLANDKQALVNQLLPFVGNNKFIANTVAGIVQPTLKQMVDINTRKEGIATFIKALDTIEKLTKLPVEEKFISLIFSKLSAMSADTVWYKMFYLNFGPDKTIVLGPENSLRANGYNMTYFYLVLWTSLYPAGVILNNARMITRGTQMNLKEFIFVSFAQALVIGVTVGIGLSQQYTYGIELYSAWSVVLGIMGLLAFTYYIVNMIINNKHLKQMYKTLPSYALEDNNSESRREISLYV